MIVSNLIIIFSIPVLISNTNIQHHPSVVTAVGGSVGITPGARAIFTSWLRIDLNRQTESLMLVVDNNPLCSGGIQHGLLKPTSGCFSRRVDSRGL